MLTELSWWFDDVGVVPAEGDEDEEEMDEDPQPPIPLLPPLRPLPDEEFFRLAKGKSGFTLSDVCSAFSWRLHLARLF